MACGIRAPVESTPSLDLGAPVRVADGLDHFHVNDEALLEPPGPVSVHLLRLDTTRVRLESALGAGEVMGLETVRETAERHRALAAINAGFFHPSGDPDGILKVGGELVSDRSNRPRGAVAIRDRAGGPHELVFDQMMVSASIAFDADGERYAFPITGIDTTRLRGRLMLFTSRYHPDTDTAPAGTEWVLSGSPLEVRERREGVGKTPIPAAGVVLSFGGTKPPAPLDLLGVGTPTAIRYAFESVHGTPPSVWEDAPQIVAGAGLLMRNGALVTDWDVERFGVATFATSRHPRTMIGVDAHDAVWLVTVDGRQRDHSLGMTLVELQRLARRIGLRDALNLDGGGSTTMVVGGRLVNSPSDVTGARAVSDALLVVGRPEIGDQGSGTRDQGPGDRDPGVRGTLSRR